MPALPDDDAVRATTTAPTIGLGVGGARRARRVKQRAPHQLGVGHHFSWKSASTYSSAIEGQQVVNGLAHADVANRQPQVVCDGHGHAALGGAIELGEHDAGDARRRS